MSYYQNVSPSEYEGFLPLSDRQYSLTFKIKGSPPNYSTLFQSFNYGPYDMSTNKALVFNYSFDAGFNWASFTVSDTSTGAVSATSVTPYEVVTVLNANSTFSPLFTASVVLDNKRNGYVAIKSNTAIKSNERFRAYVSNSGAEIPLKFNKSMGVAELPSYFARHTVANVRSFPDSVGLLLALDSTTTTDQSVIETAGLAYVGLSLINGSATVTTANTSMFAVGDSVTVYDGATTQSKTILTVTTNTSITLSSTWGGATTAFGKIIIIHADYQLLRGRSGLFLFKKQTVNGNSQVTQIIEYAAGAKVGDLAKKTTASFTGTQSAPDTFMEVPWTLTASDLITP